MDWAPPAELVVFVWLKAAPSSPGTTSGEACDACLQGRHALQRLPLRLKAPLRALERERVVIDVEVTPWCRRCAATQPGSGGKASAKASSSAASSSSTAADTRADFVRLVVRFDVLALRRYGNVVTIQKALHALVLQAPPPELQAWVPQFLGYLAAARALQVLRREAQVVARAFVRLPRPQQSLLSSLALRWLALGDASDDDAFVWAHPLDGVDADGADSMVNASAPLLERNATDVALRGVIAPLVSAGWLSVSLPQPATAAAGLHASWAGGRTLLVHGTHLLTLARGVADTLRDAAVLVLGAPYGEDLDSGMRLMAMGVTGFATFPVRWAAAPAPAQAAPHGRDCVLAPHLAPTWFGDAVGAGARHLQHRAGGAGGSSRAAAAAVVDNATGLVPHVLFPHAVAFAQYRDARMWRNRMRETECATKQALREAAAAAGGNGGGTSRHAQAQRPFVSATAPVRRMVQQVLYRPYQGLAAASPAGAGGGGGGSSAAGSAPYGGSGGSAEVGGSGWMSPLTLSLPTAYKWRHADEWAQPLGSLLQQLQAAPAAAARPASAASHPPPLSPADAELYAALACDGNADWRWDAFPTAGPPPLPPWRMRRDITSPAAMRDYDGGSARVYTVPYGSPPLRYLPPPAAALFAPAPVDVAETFAAPPPAGAPSLPPVCVPPAVYASSWVQQRTNPTMMYARGLLRAAEYLHRHARSLLAARVRGSEGGSSEEAMSGGGGASAVATAPVPLTVEALESVTQTPVPHALRGLGGGGGSGSRSFARHPAEDTDRNPHAALLEAGRIVHFVLSLRTGYVMTNSQPAVQAGYVTTPPEWAAPAPASEHPSAAGGSGGDGARPHKRARVSAGGHRSAAAALALVGHGGGGDDEDSAAGGVGGGTTTDGSELSGGCCAATATAPASTAAARLPCDGAGTGAVRTYAYHLLVSICAQAGAYAVGKSVLYRALHGDASFEWSSNLRSRQGLLWVGWLDKLEAKERRRLDDIREDADDGGGDGGGDGYATDDDGGGSKARGGRRGKGAPAGVSNASPSRSGTDYDEGSYRRVRIALLPWPRRPAPAAAADGGGGGGGSGKQKDDSPGAVAVSADFSVIGNTQAELGFTVIGPLNAYIGGDGDGDGNGAGDGGGPPDEADEGMPAPLADDDGADVYDDGAGAGAGAASGLAPSPLGASSAAGGAGSLPLPLTFSPPSVELKPGRAKVFYVGADGEPAWVEHAILQALTMAHDPAAALAAAPPRTFRGGNDGKVFEVVSGVLVSARSGSSAAAAAADDNDDDDLPRFPLRWDAAKRRADKAVSGGGFRLVGDPDRVSRLLYLRYGGSGGGAPPLLAPIVGDPAATTVGWETLVLRPGDPQLHGRVSFAGSLGTGVKPAGGRAPPTSVPRQPITHVVDRGPGWMTPRLTFVRPSSAGGGGGGGKSKTAAAAAPSASQPPLQLIPAHGCNGWRGVHGENVLWHTLFVLLMWDVMFATPAAVVPPPPVPPAGTLRTGHRASVDTTTSGGGGGGGAGASSDGTSMPSVPRTASLASGASSVPSPAAPRPPAHRPLRLARSDAAAVGEHVRWTLKHPWEYVPRDFDAADFGTRRRPLVAARLAQLGAMSPCQLAAELAATYAAHAGCVALRLRWESFPLADLAELAHAAGPRPMEHVLSRLADDFGAFFAGLPDLAVWKPLPCPHCPYGIASDAEAAHPGGGFGPPPAVAAAAGSGNSGGSSSATNGAGGGSGGGAAASNDDDFPILVDFVFNAPAAALAAAPAAPPPTARGSSGSGALPPLPPQLPPSSAHRLAPQPQAGSYVFRRYDPAAAAAAGGAPPVKHARGRWRFTGGALERMARETALKLDGRLTADRAAKAHFALLECKSPGDSLHVSQHGWLAHLAAAGVLVGVAEVPRKVPA